MRGWFGTSHTGPSNLLDDVGSSVGFPQISLYFSSETYSIDQIYLKAIQHSSCILNPVKLFIRWSFFCEIREWVSSVNYFREKTISQKFDWALTMPLILSSNVNWPGRQQKPRFLGLVYPWYVLYMLRRRNGFAKIYYRKIKYITSNTKNFKVQLQ